ncbi:MULTISPECIES: hypothetical protein [unclassified Anabaena]|uniref:hypothetical protein n=1 Tax=unclassified Anabaena TaxID=2619674 RepID=UPI001446CBE7|nr:MULTISPECIES: hypothetical protein [unclassified Anabaena]MTJ07366.1 hypothetical protein [Anabaena sp. UHCC 0204]MTJ55086.1 hypothetical protein [Anabaena sp. UHCC 0253]
MVTIVVLINFLISFALFYLAQQLWKIKHTLAVVTASFDKYERASYAALHTAPENIYIGQQKINNLRLDNQILKQQIQQLRQILNLILLVKQIAQGSFWLPISNLKNKNHPKSKNPGKLG